MVYFFSLPIAGSKAHNGLEISLKSCLKLAEPRKNRLSIFFWGASFHMLEGGLPGAVWSSLESEAMERLWTPSSRPCNMWFKIRTIINCEIRGSPAQFWFLLWWPRHCILKFQTSDSLFKERFLVARLVGSLQSPSLHGGWGAAPSARLWDSTPQERCSPNSGWRVGCLCYHFPGVTGSAPSISGCLQRMATTWTEALC